MNKKLLMLSSQRGSPNGVLVNWYLAGQTYELSESLAAIFIKEGWAVDAEAPAIEMPKAEIAPAHKAEYARKPRR